MGSKHFPKLSQFLVGKAQYGYNLIFVAAHLLRQSDRQASEWLDHRWCSVDLACHRRGCRALMEVRLGLCSQEPWELCWQCGIVVHPGPSNRKALPLCSDSGSHTPEPLWLLVSLPYEAALPVLQRLPTASNTGTSSLCSDFAMLSRCLGLLRA